METVKEVLIRCVVLFRTIRDNRQLIDDTIREELLRGIDQTERECSELIDKLEEEEED